MYYELSNPSDPYVFHAPSHEVAALAVFILGEGRYGAKPETGDDTVPVFLFGGASEWYAETFGRSVDEGLKALEADIADSLASFMFGHFADRRRYDAALKAITDPEKRQAFIDDWQDWRSSLNDIGGRAHKIAAILRERAAAQKIEAALQEHAAKGGGDA